MTALDFWLSRLSPGYQRVAAGTFRRWQAWLKGNGGKFSGLTPDELLEFQRSSSGDTSYDILDQIQRYLSEASEWRLSYKKGVYATLRSFFMHNRAELPRDGSFILRSEKTPHNGQITVDEFRMMLASCNLMYRAIFLCMFQGALGISEWLHWNKTGWNSLKAQLDAGARPIRIDLPGRKKNRNLKPYYTFISRDAIKALQDWIPHRPKDVETIFVSQTGSPLSEWGLRMYWLRHLEKLGLIHKQDTAKLGDEKYGIRYGKNLHELRDTFRTRWEKSGASSTAAEYFMGHNVDPLEYNKAFRDEDYAAGQYLEAEPWLNVLSEEPEKVPVRDLNIQRQHIRKLEVEVEMLRAGQGSDVDSLRNELGELRAMFKIIIEKPELIDNIKKKLP